MGDVIAMRPRSVKANASRPSVPDDFLYSVVSSIGGAFSKTLSTFSPDHQEDVDLLCSVLAGGPSKRLVANRLVSHYGSFAAVVSASISELCRFAGLTKAEVLAIKTVQAAALRLVRSDLDSRCVISNRQSLIDHLVASYSRDCIENFRVLFLNSRNRLLADEIMARGTVNHVFPYPREVLKRAIELNATALILVHNHPSGDPTPSADDIAATACISELATAMQMRVHDHIVISRTGIASLRDLGLLPSTDG